MNTQEPTQDSQEQRSTPSSSVPDRLINLLVQLQRNRKYGSFGAPSNPTGERA